MQQTISTLISHDLTMTRPADARATQALDLAGLQGAAAATYLRVPELANQDLMGRHRTAAVPPLEVGSLPRPTLLVGSLGPSARLLLPTLQSHPMRINTCLAQVEHQGFEQLGLVRVRGLRGTEAPVMAQHMSALRELAVRVKTMRQVGAARDADRLLRQTANGLPPGALRDLLMGALARAPSQPVRALVMPRACVTVHPLALGDVAQLMHGALGLTGKVRARVARAVTYAALLNLSEMHAEHIVFNDLRPSNVLVWPDGTLSLHNYARSFPLGGEPCRSMEAFLAPEAFRGKRERDARRRDIFSAGALLLNLATGYLSPPYTGQTSACMLQDAADYVAPRSLQQLMERWYTPYPSGSRAPNPFAVLAKAGANELDEFAKAFDTLQSAEASLISPLLTLLQPNPNLRPTAATAAALLGRGLDMKTEAAWAMQWLLAKARPQHLAQLRAVSSAPAPRCPPEDLVAHEPHAVPILPAPDRSDPRRVMKNTIAASTALLHHRYRQVRASKNTVVEQGLGMQALMAHRAVIARAEREVFADEAIAVQLAQVTIVRRQMNHLATPSRRRDRPFMPRPSPLRQLAYQAVLTDGLDDVRSVASEATEASSWTSVLTCLLSPTSVTSALSDDSDTDSHSE